MDQRPPLGRRRGGKRRRSSSGPRFPSADAGRVQDIFACVRFSHGSCFSTVKWLSLKIPGILIQKIESSCCSQTADLTPHYHHSGMEVFHSTHHLKLKSCLNKMFLQRYVTCKLDPVFNGPFIFPFPHGKGILFNTCASVGSVVFVLAGYDDHFDPQAREQVYLECAGFHPTKTRQIVTGPSICGGKRLNSSPPKRPPACTSDNTCYHLQYCDFSKPNPQWKMSSQVLVSPRIVPKLISLQGMLFAFGGTSPSDPNATFAEAFDPDVGFWEPLPTPPFGRLGLYELNVFPLPTSGRILVAGTKSGIRYTFELSTWCWHPFEPIYFNQGFDILDGLQTRIRLYTDPVLSVFDEAIYWIDRYGRLCVYNVVGDGRYYAGSIRGLHLEDNGELFKDRSTYMTLLPLSKHLMGLLWFSNESNDVDENVITNSFSSALHVTILHVSVLPEMDIEDEDDEVHYSIHGIPLTVSSVACLSFPLEGTKIAHVIDACLMDEGEGNIF